MKSEFLLVAKRLMETERHPMSAQELIKLGMDRQLFSDKIAGETPHQTMKAKLSVHIRRLGRESLFIRTEPGRFYLRDLVEGNTVPFEATPVAPVASSERVCVYRTAELDHLMTWQGLSTSWKKVTHSMFATLRRDARERLEIEENNDYTQLLTYVLVTRGDAVLAYRRGTYSRTERFLKGSFCVGFGGHVIEPDFSLFHSGVDGILESAARELMEELSLPDVDIRRLRRHDALNIVGLINDDSSDVGRRHLAFVLNYEVSGHSYWDHPERGEKAITQLHWIWTAAKRDVSLWNFEYWSQLCLRAFRPRLVRTRPAYRLLRRSPLKPPHIVCMIGPVGSGKTIAADVLEADFGYRGINSGRVLASLLGIKPVSAARRSLFQDRAWDFITQEAGPSELAKRIVEIAKGWNCDRVVVDGIRHRSTVAALRHFLGPRRLGIVFVQTPVDLAFNFFRERFKIEATMSEFLAARAAPVEGEVEGLISEADAVLYNWSGTPQYRATIRAMMKRLRVSRWKGR